MGHPVVLHATAAGRAWLATMENAGGDPHCPGARFRNTAAF
jgi:DNA-binding IclR family transcriptional regulator